MNLASWGPLGSALGGLLGRLGAILSVFERYCGISELSCTSLGVFWGPLGSSWGSLECLEGGTQEENHL